MLLSNLKVLLAERNLTISKVSMDTSISRTTLTALANNTSAGIQFETLDKICQYLNVDPSNFFLFYNGNLEIEFISDSQSSFFTDISFCRKKLSVFCDFSYHLEQVDHSFYLDYKDNSFVNPHVFINEISIYISQSNSEPEINSLDIKKTPLPIKQIIQEKISEHSFQILQQINENLVPSDKTKWLINWE